MQAVCVAALKALGLTVRVSGGGEAQAQALARGAGVEGWALTRREYQRRQKEQEATRLKGWKGRVSPAFFSTSARPPPAKSPTEPPGAPHSPRGHPRHYHRSDRPSPVSASPGPPWACLRSFRHIRL